MNDPNILKPSQLANPSPSTSSNDAFNLQNLKTIISEIVREESNITLNRLINGQTDNNIDTDQGIDAIHRNNLQDMDKIPDIVKSLRDFSGQPGEFGSWKKSVERILKIYEHLKGTPKYYGILSVIRNKITKDADIALESYNTPLQWERISKCLSLHYADKRDIGTLEYQMTTLIQKHNSITDYYQEVYYHLSLILNKLSSMDMSQDSMNMMTKTYRDKALDTFIRGLKGDLPKLLSMREPTDLPQALHLCLKLENVNYRTQYSHNNVRIPSFSIPPPLPPKRQDHIRNQFTNNRQFHPQLLQNPQSGHNPFVFNRPQRPTYFNQQQRAPMSRYQNNNFNNFSKPEPMEIDQSMRTRQVNYMNRPQNYQHISDKRPASQQIHQNHNKLQRINNTEQCSEDSNLERYEEQSRESDPHYDQPITESADYLEDINFLD